MNFLVDIMLVMANGKVIVEAEDKKSAVDKASELIQQGKVQFFQTQGPQDGVVFVPHQMTDAEFEETKLAKKDEAASDLVIPEEKKLIIPGA